MAADIVTARFRLDEKTETIDGYRLKFGVVTGGSDENDKFFKYTPYGSIEMGTVNKDAADMFVSGGEYDLTFTPVES